MPERARGPAVTTRAAPGLHLYVPRPLSRFRGPAWLPSGVRLNTSTYEPLRQELRPAPEPIVTYEMLREMPEDGVRYEIFEGNLQMVPSPTPRHQDVVFRLARIVDDQVRVHDPGRAEVPLAQVWA